VNNNQILIILFGLLYLTLVLYTRRKGNFEEFSVAGRGLGVFLIFTSMSASYLGPGFTLGLTRVGYSDGLFMLIIGPIAGVVMMFAGSILAPNVRAKFVSSYSIGDILGGNKSHDNRYVKALAGVATILFTSALVVAMSYAGGELINNVFGFSKTWSIIIVTSVVVLYSLFGGIRATIQTDAIQFIHFVILIPILALLVTSSDQFSWTDYFNHASTATKGAFESRSLSAIFGIFIIWFFGANGADASIVSRYLASDSTKTAKTAVLMAGAFISIWIALMVFIGSVGSYLYPHLAIDDQILLHISKEYFPGIFYGIFIIAMIGVVMSTQDTLLNNAGVSFSEDIAPLFNSKITNEQKLLLSKIYTIVLGIIAIIVANYVDSVLGVILSLVEYYVPVMIPVTFFSVLKNKHYWHSAISSMITGLLIFILWKEFGYQSVPPILVALTIGTMVYLTSDLVISRKALAKHPLN
jgi:SSS family solute:Na+ symporter